MVVRESCARAKQLKLMHEAVRQGHRSDIVPQGFAGPAIRSVMKNEKIADALVLHFVEAVELIGQPRGCPPSPPRHEIYEIDNRRLDQVEAGGLERVEKAPRQTHPGANPPPSPFAPPR